MEDVIAFGVSERKKKEESPSKPTGEKKWIVSDYVLYLIVHIICKALSNNPTLAQAVFTPRLVSLLIGVGEVCGGSNGRYAIESVRHFIQNVSLEQLCQMVEMDVHQRILGLTSHSDDGISNDSSFCINHILTRLEDSGSDSSKKARSRPMG